MVDNGRYQSFTIAPTTGYHVADVTVDGVSQGAITGYSFVNVTADHTISATFVSNNLTLTIDSPSDGATIYRPDVMVKGTLANAGSYDIGVTVNGVAAIVYGDQFAANHVPLQDGSNIITATATDVNGLISTASATVNAVTTGNYIRLTANPESGVAVLSTILRIDGVFSIATSTISVSGPAQPVVIALKPDQYNIYNILEGMYFFTASVTGPDENTYQDSIAIAAMDRTQLDALLRNKWEGIKASLMQSDIDGALNYISSDSQEKYRDAFTSLQSVIGQIVTNMNDIKLVYIKDKIAKYRITRNQVINGQTETITYYIYFGKNSNGIWQIEQF